MPSVGPRKTGSFFWRLAETVNQSGLCLHGYCLMPNHFHLLVETPQGNLSRAVGWLQTIRTIRFTGQAGPLVDSTFPRQSSSESQRRES
jgi:REP element-mobilizing transposase RayT